MSKKKTIIILVILIIINGGWYFYTSWNSVSIPELDNLKKEQPELAVYIDDILVWEKNLKEDENNLVVYSSLGFAWKSLADRTLEPKHYQRALEVYQQGIEKSQRKNSTLIMNAGNMAKYLEDYELAADYYQEAISLAPGESSYYISLAELYEFQLKKPKEEVLAVYDEALKRVMNPDFIERRKQSFLERIGEVNQ